MFLCFKHRNFKFRPPSLQTRAQKVYIKATIEKKIQLTNLELFLLIFTYFLWNKRYICLTIANRSQCWTVCKLQVLQVLSVQEKTLLRFLFYSDCRSVLETLAANEIDNEIAFHIKNMVYVHGNRTSHWVKAHVNKRPHGTRPQKAPCKAPRKQKSRWISKGAGNREVIDVYFPYSFLQVKNILRKEMMLEKPSMWDNSTDG